MEHQVLNSTLSTDIRVKLVEGDSTEEFVVYVVSDKHIYGCKHKSRLRFSLAKIAVKNGFVPGTYQAIHWLCFAYIPVVPLGTYVVIDRIANDDSDVDIYRGYRIEMDWRQAIFHWCMAAAVIVGTIISICVVSKL